MCKSEVTKDKHLCNPTIVWDLSRESRKILILILISHSQMYGVISPTIPIFETGKAKSVRWALAMYCRIRSMYHKDAYWVCCSESCPKLAARTNIFDADSCNASS